MERKKGRGFHTRHFELFNVFDWSLFDKLDKQISVKAELVKNQQS